MSKEKSNIESFKVDKQAKFETFCSKLDRNCNLSEVDKMKLFSLVNLLEDGIICRYFDSITTTYVPKSVEIPTLNEESLTAFRLSENEKCFIKGYGETSIHINSDRNTIHSAYVLSLFTNNRTALTNKAKTDLEKISCSWHESKNIVNLLMECVDDICTKRSLSYGLDIFCDVCTVDWEKLKTAINEKYNVSIPKLSRSNKPSVQKVYVKLVDYIVSKQVDKYVKEFLIEHTKSSFDENWNDIVHAMNKWYNIEMMTWQIIKTTKGDLSNRILISRLVEVIQSKMWKFGSVSTYF